MVDGVIETGPEGWVVKLGYFVTDYSKALTRRSGRFVVKPTDQGVEFIKAY